MEWKNYPKLSECHPTESGGQFSDYNQKQQDTTLDKTQKLWEAFLEAIGKLSVDLQKRMEKNTNEDRRFDDNESAHK